MNFHAHFPLGPVRLASRALRRRVGAAVLIGACGACGTAMVTTASPVVVPPGAVKAPAHGQPAPVTATAGIVPPSNPPQNIAPSPNFLNTCSGAQFDNSSACTNAALQAIDNARAHEGIGPMALPSQWYSLSPAEQLYVATNVERADRGLPVLSGMASALDGSAAQGAAASQDPEPPGGFPWSSWGSNWAGAVGNPLEAMYYWMYDDGEGSGNIDCTPSNTSGCWGHRDNVLMSLRCQPCDMGTAYNGSGYQGYPSWAEILVDTSGSPRLDFSWSQVYPSGPAPSGPPPSAASGGNGPAPGVLEQSNGTPSMFVEGPGGALMNYWYIPQSGSWGAGTVAGPGNVASAPGVVAQPDGAPSVFVEGPGGSLLNYWYIPSSGSWGEGTVAGPGSVNSEPAVIEQSNGTPSVFVEGPGGALMNYWYIPQGGGWGAATVAGQGNVSSTPGVLEQSNGAPTVFVEGPGGSLMNYWYIPQGGGWGAATVAGLGNVASGPTVVPQSDGAPSVFVEGPGGSLLNFWYIPQGGGWGAGTVAGLGNVASAPSALEQSNGSPSVFVEGPGGSLMNFWYIAQNGSWGSGTVAGLGSVSSAPGVVAQANGAPSVFVSNPDLNFWYIPQSGSWGAGTIAS